MTAPITIDTLVPQLNKYIQSLTHIRLNNLDLQIELPKNAKKDIKSTTLPASFILDLMLSLNDRLIRYFGSLKKVDHAKTWQIVEQLIAQSANDNMGIMVKDLLKKLEDNYSQIRVPLNNEFNTKTKAATILGWLSLAFFLSSIVLAIVSLFFPALPILATAAAITLGTSIVSSISCFALIFDSTPEKLANLPSLSNTVWNYTPENKRALLADSVMVGKTNEYAYDAFFSVKNPHNNKTLCDETQEQYEQLQPS